MGKCCKGYKWFATPLEVTMRRDMLVTYDVNTETKEGRQRLQKVAKVCEGYGQRVQKSVFECSLTDVLLTIMKQKLLKIIDLDQDSLRFYQLPGGRDNCVECYGRDTYRDFQDPLVI